MMLRTSVSRARRLGAGVALGIALAAAALPSGAEPAPTAAPAPQDKADKAEKEPKAVLDKDRKGRDALDALGTQLDHVAAAHKMTPGKLKKLLETDDTLWVGDTGRLYYVDPAGTAPAEAGTTAPSTGVGAAAVPYDQTFTLHSNPGADRVVYLDFNGHYVSGTAWNKAYVSKSGAYTATGFDMDGSPSTFSTAEMDVVQSVWARVAEDYAPFVVDVTTEDPGSAAIDRSTTSDTSYGARVVITNTTTGFSTSTGTSQPCQCGGIAYVGVFDLVGTYHAYYQPAFVYQRGVGTNPKYIAEAAAHEAGHNLGLSHDGTATLGYYSGQGSWAPIMGVGYYKAITQWSRGQYAGANNTEDDLALIAANGAPLRADDHADTPAAATPLTGAPLSGSGRIGTASDVDAFSFQGEAGSQATVTVTPATPGPDLDASLELVGPTGSPVKVDPPSGSTDGDTATGLGASLTVQLPATGTYTVLVDGVGAGDPAGTGYSDYASLGRYTVTATVGTNQPPIAVATASPPVGPAPLDVSFSSAGSADPEGKPLTFLWDFGDGTPTTTDANPGHRYTTDGTYTATLTVTDDAGKKGTATVLVTVADNQGPTAVAAASATSGPAPLTVSFSSAGSSDPEQQPLTYAWAFGDGTTSTAAAPTVTYSSPGVYAATLTVTDAGNLTSSAQVTVRVGVVDVGSVTLTAVRTSSRNVTATATVNLTDGGAPVGSVAVTGRFTYGTSGTNKTATANGAGVATLSSGSVRLTTGSTMEFCVTNLSRSGYTWTKDLVTGGDCTSIQVP